jgi:hypothetical protein
VEQPARLLYAGLHAVKDLVSIQLRVRKTSANEANRMGVDYMPKSPRKHLNDVQILKNVKQAPASKPALRLFLEPSLVSGIRRFNL